MPIPFAGRIVKYQELCLLVFGPGAEALGAPVFGPPLDLHPAYPWKQGGYLLPQQVFDDFGQVYDPPDSYLFIEMRGDAFPRADVVGMLPGGEPQTVFMKELDLPEMRVFAAPAAGLAGFQAVRVDLAVEAAAQPEAQPAAVIPFPVELFARALPCCQLSPGAPVEAALVRLGFTPRGG